MNANQRQQLLVILVVLAVALLFSDRLVVTPLASVWKTRSARVSELRELLVQGELLAQRENVIRARWSAMRGQTLPSIPSSAENELLKAFERWSRDSRLSISAIKPQWREGDEDYLSLECRAEGFGSMEALTRFLYEVEKDSLPVKVDTVEITTRDPQGQALTLGLQVSGLVLRVDKPTEP
jgi:hypothetical protein